MGPYQSTVFAATLTLLFAASMQAQMQVDRTRSVQGAHGDVPSAAGDRTASSDGTVEPGVYRDKHSVDVRDWGVDCIGIKDAAAILNSHTNVQDGISGQRISIPSGCIIKLTTDQWQIYGNEGWEVEGVGILARKPLIEYCGPSGPDSVLKIERSGGWTIKGVNIQDGGSGCSNTTPNGVIVDNDRTGGYTTTDGLFDRVYVSPSTAIKNWIGINIAPVSRSNAEDMRLVNSLIGCANSPGGVGVYIGSSFNAKMEDFQHTQIVQCPGGAVYQYNGGMLLRGMDSYGNTGDVVLGPGSDPTLIEGLTSESPQMITTSGAANYPATIAASHVGWAGGLSSGLCGIDLTHAFAGSYLFLGSGVDTPPAGAFPLCATTSSNLTLIGTQFGFGNNATSSGNAGFILPKGKTFGGTFSLFNGGRLRMGNGANYGTEDIGYGFFTQYGAELPGYGFNAQSLEDGHVPGTLSIGRDVMYIGNQNITVKGMWPIPMQSISCTYTGTVGKTQWTVEVFPKDALGNRGGLISFNGRQCGGSATSTLDASDYLTVVWPRVTAAVSYDVVLVNPANTSRGLLFANVSDPGSGATATTNINSGGTRSTFNYPYPNFYDSAITTINGESLIVNAPPTFTAAVTLPALNLTTTYISATTPTISSGFGASSSIAHSNGTAVFTINVGAGGTASSGVIGLPSAMNGWAVHCDDITTQSTSVFVTKQTATSTTSATITQYSATAVATPWAASDVLVCQAAAY